MRTGFDHYRIGSLAARYICPDSPLPGILLRRPQWNRQLVRRSGARMRSAESEA